MASVSLDRISKRFESTAIKSDAGTLVVDEISLEVFDREFLVLVGPSGCGKSTTLRMIAGLETCTSGTIRIGDRVVNNIAPKDRNIAMVFQNYALYPHMSVYKNLSFGLTLRFGGGVIARGLRKIFQSRRATELAAQQLAQLPAGIDGQVRQTATRLGINHLLNRQPHQLSGGERQRVALGRAIVRNPAVFLFDEPLSNLDAKLRQQMRNELRRLHRELQATIIYVTHDQTEAMALGDRVAVMNHGRILQIGAPLEVYQSPANLFVARFIGSVPMNLVSGVINVVNGVLEFRGDGMVFRPAFNPSENSGHQSDLMAKKGGRQIILGFRAEDLAVVDDKTDAKNETEGGLKKTKRPDNTTLSVTEDLVATVILVERLGETTLAHVTINNDPKINHGEQTPDERNPDGQDHESTKTKSRNEPNRATMLANIKLHPTADPLVVRLPPTYKVAADDILRLRIDRDRILWFDPQTGQAL